MEATGSDLEQLSLDEEEEVQDAENEESPEMEKETPGTELEGEATQGSSQAVDQQKDCTDKDGSGETTCPERVDPDESILKDLEERRKHVQEWMENLSKTKQDEFNREEAAMIPLRHYLMAHVVPTLTKGLIEITRARPEDPVDFLAEFLFQNNPGTISSKGAQTFKAEMLN